MIATIIILSIVILLLLLLLASVVGMNLKNVEMCKGWQNMYQQLHNEYRGLEQGRDEESEAYEQQYLSFMDTVESQATAIGSYIEDLHFLVSIGEKHFENCLPDMGEKDQERFFKIRETVILEG